MATTSVENKVALIVGAGPGISGAFAASLRNAGYAVALASRDLARLEPLAANLGASAFAADAADAGSLQRLFTQVDQALGEPEVVLYNPSARVRGELLSLDPAAVADAVNTTATGAFVCAQEAARRMLPKRRGVILFTGATAGVKGFAKSSAFAMGKLALPGLVQSLARELSPQGIHVAHFVIDGSVQPDGAGPNRLTPRAIAQSYMAILAQPPGAWSWEIELRSRDEPF